MLVEVFKFRRERERGGVVILQVPWGKEKGEAAEKGGERGRGDDNDARGKTQQKEHARSHLNQQPRKKKEIKKEN